jgi:hypothetical protein
MRLSITSIGLAFAICLSSLAVSQTRKAGTLPERNSMEWFNEAANFESKTLLFKVLQFTAPYPGYYEETSLDITGNAFSARIVPDWATQGIQSATLQSVRLNQVREMLLQLYLPATSTQLEPQAGQLHSAFVFYDGSSYRHLRFNGDVPAQLQAILEIVQKELIAAAKVRAEEFMAHSKLMEETYGDWKNRDGITVPNSSRMRGFQNSRGLLIGLLGQRKATSPAEPLVVSIYHAIVLYPAGGVTGGAGGRNWSDDPVSRNGVSWTLPNSAGSSSDNTSRRELEIEHNAIDETVRIDGKTYYLSQGNLFIIRMGEDWKPAVTQLNERLSESASEQDVLDRFKSITRGNDGLQESRLYKQ